MKNEALDKSNEKFLFHLNIFDDSAAETDPMTALLYHEGDMAKARTEAFQEGKNAGNKEAQESIQKQTALLLQQVQNSFGLLFASENDRDAQFEREATMLITAIFEKIFPLYHEKFGMAEIEHSLKALLQKHSDHKKIILQVAPALEQPIDKLLSEAGLDYVEVQPSQAIKGQTCILNWKDGGAEIKDTAVLAEEIRDTLKQLLDEKAAKGHDSKELSVKGESP